MENLEFLPYADAVKLFENAGFSESTFKRKVKNHFIHSQMPEGRARGALYSKKDIQDAISELVKRVEEKVQATSESDKILDKAIREVPMQTDLSASFVRATPGDMDALYKMAVKLFPHTAGPERRKEWIRHEPRGHYVMKRDDGSIVAYFYILALKRDRRDLELAQRDRMALFLRRELRNTQITAYDIHQFVPNQPMDLALGGIGSDPDLEPEQRTAYTAMLLRGARHDLGNLGKEGFVFSNAYTFSETKDGIALCVKLGMHEWEPPRGKFLTFQIDILDTPSPLFREYQHGLSEYRRYQKADL